MYDLEWSVSEIQGHWFLKYHRNDKIHFNINDYSLQRHSEWLKALSPLGLRIHAPVYLFNSLAYSLNVNGMTFLYFSITSHDIHSNKKSVLSQRWPRNARYMWVPSNFSGLPDYAHGYYSQHFHGFFFRSTLWMFVQNLKSVALPAAEIIGGTQKFVQFLDTPTLHFLQNF